MTRKRNNPPPSRPRARSRAASPRATRTTVAGSPQTIRKPKSWRVVTARVLPARVADGKKRAPRREVPEIRLSGAWLERIGFPKGMRYLISADRPFRTIILQASMPKLGDRRRRRSA